MVIPAHHLAGNRTNASPLDTYNTPMSATLSLMKRIKFEGDVWECACGLGDMAGIILQFNPCRTSDITTGTDFLLSTDTANNIITNPPYKLAERFVRKANQLATKKVAMFLRLNFLEGQARYKMFRELPLEWVLVFSKRQTLHPEGVIVNTGGTIAYAWFVWNKEYKGYPQIDWIKD